MSVSTEPFGAGQGNKGAVLAHIGHASARIALKELQGRPPTEVIRYLQQHGLIDAATVELFSRLRRLRNEAAHADGHLRLSLDEAIEYRALCRSLSDALDAAFGKLQDRASQRDP